MFLDLKDNSLQQLATRFQKRRIDLKSAHYCDLLCDEIAFEMVTRGERGVHALLELLNSRNGLKYRSILCGLSALKSKTVTLPVLRTVKKVLIDALKDERSLVKADALYSLRHLRLKRPEADILPHLSSEVPYLAANALNYVCEFFSRRCHRALKDAAKSRYFLVREASVDEIDDRHLTEFLPMIANLRRDRHPDVRQAAENAYRNLAK